MDFSHIAHELEIEESEYLALLDVFRKQTSKDLEALEHALTESNLTAVHAAAHSIKGASGSLNLAMILEAATEICTCATSGSQEPIAAKVTTIRTELMSLSDQLAKAKEVDDNG